MNLGEIVGLFYLVFITKKIYLKKIKKYRTQFLKRVSK